MTEEIIDVKGNQFKLTYDIPSLTNEQMNHVKTVIMKETCSSCGSSGSAIKVLGTCSKGSVVQGGNINLSVPSITGGTSPYDITFYKMAPGSSTKQTIGTPDLNVSTFPLNHNNITVPTTDVTGDWTYGIDVVDHCTGTPAGSCSANCTLTVLTPNSITVTSPNGGESWGVGTQHSVTWSYVGLTGTTVKIDLVVGASVLNLATTQPIGTGGTGSYTWNILTSLLGGSNYKIRITSNFDATVLDESNAAFTLVDKGDVFVSSNPTGAAIIIDSVPQPFPTNSTVTGLTVGSHLFTLTLSGYNVYNGSFNIVAGTTVDACTPAPCQLVVTPTTQAATTQAATTQAATTQAQTTFLATTLPVTTQGQTTQPVTGYGTINCSTNPTLAEIWLDGSDTGHSTPYTLLNVATGLHYISFRKVGYENCSVQKTVYANQEAIASCTMIQDGQINCSTNPVGADIWLDGTDTLFVTPWTLLNVSPGSHTVTFKLPGYADCSVGVSIYSNQVTDATCTMQVLTTTIETNKGLIVVGIIALGALTIALSRRPAVVKT